MVGWRRGIYSYPPVGSPDGGAHVTAGDLTAFHRALRAGRLLGPESTAAILTPKEPHGEPGGHAPHRLTASSSRSTADGDVVSYWKEGINVGVSGVLSHWPGHRVTFALLSNRQQGAWEPIGRSTRRSARSVAAVSASSAARSICARVPPAEAPGAAAQRVDRPEHQHHVVGVVGVGLQPLVPQRPAARVELGAQRLVLGPVGMAVPRPLDQHPRRSSVVVGDVVELDMCQFRHCTREVYRTTVHFTNDPGRARGPVAPKIAAVPDTRASDASSWRTSRGSGSRCATSSTARPRRSSAAA